MCGMEEPLRAPKSPLYGGGAGNVMPDGLPGAFFVPRRPCRCCRAGPGYAVAVIGTMLSASPAGRMFQYCSTAAGRTTSR